MVSGCSVLVPVPLKSQMAQGLHAWPPWALTAALSTLMCLNEMAWMLSSGGEFSSKCMLCEITIILGGITAMTWGITVMLCSSWCSMGTGNT